MEIILPVAVSLLTQWLKKYSPNEWWTLAIVLGLSVVAAFIYTALVTAGYWKAFVPILALAGAFYTFILKRFV